MIGIAKPVAIDSDFTMAFPTIDSVAPGRFVHPARLSTRKSCGGPGKKIRSEISATTRALKSPIKTKIKSAAITQPYLKIRAPDPACGTGRDAVPTWSDWDF
jgi:hypothetical protein